MKTSPLAWCSTSPLISRHCSAVSWPSSDAHVAEEDDVELRKLVEPGRELLDVVLVAAARLAQARVEQQARQLDARVARQGIPQVAVLPARVRLDDQDAELLLADRDRRRERVVVGRDLVGVLGDVEREGEVAGRPSASRPASRWCGPSGRSGLPW